MVLDAGELLLRGGVDLLELPADPLRDDPLLHRAQVVHRSRLGASGGLCGGLGEGKKSSTERRGQKGNLPPSLLSWWRRDETRPQRGGFCGRGHRLGFCGAAHWAKIGPLSSSAPSEEPGLIIWARNQVPFLYDPSKKKILYKGAGFFYVFFKFFVYQLQCIESYCNAPS